MSRLVAYESHIPVFTLVAFVNQWWSSMVYSTDLNQEHTWNMCFKMSQFLVHEFQIPYFFCLYLTDTEKFYTVVQERILARFGKTFDWSLKAKMMGKKAIESARIFVEELGLDGLLTPEGFLEEREEMLQDLFPTAELMPGIL